jgi:hypothetical protein
MASIVQGGNWLTARCQVRCRCGRFLRGFTGKSIVREVVDCFDLQGLCDLGDDKSATVASVGMLSASHPSSAGSSPLQLRSHATVSNSVHMIILQPIST